VMTMAMANLTKEKSFLKSSRRNQILITDRMVDSAKSALSFSVDGPRTPDHAFIMKNGVQKNLLLAKNQ
jgi:hypothetical protein